MCAIAVDRAKYLPDLIDSAASAVDMSARIWTFVVPVSAATGSMTVTTPAGQGVLCYGVQRNTPAATVGSRIEIGCNGIEEVIADGAFNAGIELAVAGTNGKAGAAASGDWVMGFSREAATGADHKISMRLIDPYIKP